MSSQTLFVVHCIDTEGPLKETLNATFARLNKTFRLNFKPSKKKLNEIAKTLKEKFPNLYKFKTN